MESTFSALALLQLVVEVSFSVPGADFTVIDLSP